jgi:hypothetical protein
MCRCIRRPRPRRGARQGDFVREGGVELVAQPLGPGARARDELLALHLADAEVVQVLLEALAFGGRGRADALEFFLGERHVQGWHTSDGT